MRGSATELAEFQMLPGKLCNMPCCEPILLSDEAPERDNHQIIKILKRIPCPNRQLLNNIQEKWMAEGKNSFRAIKVSHGNVPTILPSWVLTWWDLVAQYWEDIVSWKKAYRALHEEIDCDRILQLLSTIPWNHPCPVPGVKTSDLAWFATKKWLSDNHVHLLAWFLDGAIKSEKMRLLSCDYSGKIFESFKTSKTTMRRYRFLDAAREKLRTGEWHQIGFCIHVVAGQGLPMAPLVGNHWVAVVIDGQNRRILFGDSLGYPAHPSIIQMLHWWLRPAFNFKFPVAPLQYNGQATPWSCADRAINMLAHHFEPRKFLLLGGSEENEVQNRVKLLLAIVKKFRCMTDFTLIDRCIQ